MNKIPCKDCEDRHSGCHGKCEKYITWKFEHDAERERLYKEKEQLYRLDNYKDKVIRKITKQRKRII